MPKLMNAALLWMQFKAHLEALFKLVYQLLGHSCQISKRMIITLISSVNSNKNNYHSQSKTIVA